MEKNARNKFTKSKICCIINVLPKKSRNRREVKLMKQKRRTVKKHRRLFLHKLLENMKIILEIAKVMKEIIKVFW